jgi:hypothetical protein
MDLPPSAETVNTENTFKKLWNLSVAKSTWGKYNSGLNAFACFEADHCTSFPWPLTTGVFRAFATWCVGKRNLQPSTVRTYLSSLKFVHHMRGLPCDHLDKDKVMTIILRGAFNHFLMKKTVSSTRRVVTFPLLRVLGHRIARSQWDPLSKQVIWSAATTAFFASTRLGEILASEEQDFSPSSDLLWEDVIFTDTPGSESVLIRLKQPKSGEKEGEYVDLFPFLGYNCCPVRTLRELRAQQIEAGTYHPSLPVFRFKSGANLTPSHFNTVLADLLSDLCSPGSNTITCHSFRAGIPSTVSMFPELATSDLVKGWGRWKSECYTLYTRLQLHQRAGIFGQIATALRSSLCSVQ